MFVYVLKSLTSDRHYVGMTNNVERRLHEHNSGQVKSTKHYAPFKLLHTEFAANRVAARKLEKYFKSGIGRDKINTFEN